MATTPLKAALFLAGGTAAAAAVAYFAGVIDPFLPQPPAAVSGAPANPPADAGAKDARLEQPAAPSAPEAEAPAAPAPGPVLSFDIVRVEADGSIVMAGRAPAAAFVEILSDQTDVIGSATAGQEGDFAVVFQEPLAPGDYQLSLRATSPDKTVLMSSETAVVSIPETADGEVLAMVQEPGKPAELISVPKAGGPTPPPAAAEAPPLMAAEPPAEGQPPAGVAAVEPPPPMTAQPAPPAPAAPVPAIALAVEAIEIEGSSIFIAGIADPGRRVRAYANELLVGDALTSPGGRFLVEADMDLPVGEYMVRIDALADDGGTVVARAVVPFEREPGESIAAVAPPPSENPPAEAPPAVQPPAVTAPPGAPVADGQPPAGQDVAVAQPPVSDQIVPPAANAPPSADAPPAVVVEAPPAVSDGTVPPMVSPPPAAEQPAPPVVAVQPPEVAPPSTVPPAMAPPAVEAVPSVPPVAVPPGAAPVPPAVAVAPPPGAPSEEVAVALPPSAPVVQPPAAEPPAGVPEVVAPKLQPANAAVIIRRGDTLWRISRRVYGKGMRYSTIYLANKPQIEDPDRIWPGQVFRMPDKSDDGIDADWDRIGKRLTTMEEAEAKKEEAEAKKQQ